MVIRTQLHKSTREPKGTQAISRPGRTNHTPTSPAQNTHGAGRGGARLGLLHMRSRFASQLAKAPPHHIITCFAARTLYNMKRVRPAKSKSKSKSASRSPGESRTFAKPEEAHDRGGRGKVKSRRNPPIAHPPQTTQSAEQFRLPSHGPGRKNDQALKDTSSPCHSEGHSDYSSGERHYQPSSPHYDDHHRAAKGPKPRVSCPSNSQDAASSRHVSRQSLSPERRPYSTTSQDYGRGITGAMGRLAIAGSKHRSLPALPFHRVSNSCVYQCITCSYNKSLFFCFCFSREDLFCQSELLSVHQA